MFYIFRPNWNINSVSFRNIRRGIPRPVSNYVKRLQLLLSKFEFIVFLSIPLIPTTSVNPSHFSLRISLDLNIITAMKFTQLPPDLVVYILSFLPPNVLRKTSTVSRSYHQTVDITLKILAGKAKGK